MPTRSPCSREIRKTYGNTWDDYPCAVSIVLNMPSSVIRELALKGPTDVYARYYDVANTALDIMAMRITDWLESRGFRAFPVPASKVVKGGLYGIFSHRAAAHLAGLGWIGKSCCLITPDRGPMQRLRQSSAMPRSSAECRWSRSAGSVPAAREHVPPVPSVARYGRWGSRSRKG